jgi:hypothetical protein
LLRITSCGIGPRHFVGTDDERGFLLWDGESVRLVFECDGGERWLRWRSNEALGLAFDAWLIEDVLDLAGGGGGGSVGTTKLRLDECRRVVGWGCGHGRHHVEAALLRDELVGGCLGNEFGSHLEHGFGLDAHALGLSNLSGLELGFHDGLNSSGHQLWLHERGLEVRLDELRLFGFEGGGLDLIGRLGDLLRLEGGRGSEGQCGGVWRHLGRQLDDGRGSWRHRDGFSRSRH